MPFSFADLSIPVFLFVGIYGFFLLGYVIYGLFILVHLLEFGRAGAPLFAIVIGFLGGTALLVTASLLWLLQYDLTYTIPWNELSETFKQPFLGNELF